MEYGVCPVCNGSTRVPAEGPFKTVVYGYDQATDTFPCNNCGNQYMFGTPTGQVRLNKNGVPCTHNYEGWTKGNSTTLSEFTCLECGDKFEVDTSG